MGVDTLRYRRDRKGREKRSFGPIVNDAPDLLTYEISANAAHHATYRAGNNGAATRFDKSPERGAPPAPTVRQPSPANVHAVTTCVVRRNGLLA